MEVVGRELINDVGGEESGWSGVSFHGRHDFRKEFGASLRGSKLVGIQFTVRKALPLPATSQSGGKIGKTNLFS